MILMVSVQNLDEAMHALKGGADIVDVKNLQEASVGSANPWVVEQIPRRHPRASPRKRHPRRRPQPDRHRRHGRLRRGTHRATSVKVGFMNTEYDHAAETLLASKQALEGTDTS